MRPRSHKPLALAAPPEAGGDAWDEINAAADANRARLNALPAEALREEFVQRILQMWGDAQSPGDVLAFAREIVGIAPAAPRPVDPMPDVVPPDPAAPAFEAGWTLATAAPPPLRQPSIRVL